MQGLYCSWFCATVDHISVVAGVSAVAGVPVINDAPAVLGISAVFGVPAITGVSALTGVSAIAGIPDLAVAGGPVFLCVPAVSDVLLFLLTLLLLAPCCCYCPCCCSIPLVFVMAMLSFCKTIFRCIVCKCSKGTPVFIHLRMLPSNKNQTCIFVYYDPVGTSSGEDLFVFG